MARKTLRIDMHLCMCVYIFRRTFDICVYIYMLRGNLERVHIRFGAFALHIYVDVYTCI